MNFWHEIGTDILVVYYSLGVRDLYNVVLPLLFLPIFFFPLKGIDRRDPLTGMTFALFISLAAALLFIDQRHPPVETRAMFRQWCFLAAAVTAALARFHWPLLRRQAEQTSAATAPKEPSHGKK